MIRLVAALAGAATFAAAQALEAAFWTTAFEGAYAPWFLNSARGVGFMAGCLATVAALVAAAHGREALAMVRGWSYTLVLALIAGVVLHFLVTMWFDATSTEAWLTAGRWARLPVFFTVTLTGNSSLAVIVCFPSRRSL